MTPALCPDMENFKSIVTGGRLKVFPLILNNMAAWILTTWHTTSTTKFYWNIHEGRQNYNITKVLIRK